MQIYRVGGSVRDELLGLPVHDRDWVVIGETPESMLAAGYQSVGKDFPVFLHPESHEEYALARTERKTGPGYKGFAVAFSPDVTLEEDLARRDLTVNAMAIGADGALIDPYGGHRDLEARVLRHVTEAFAEDPLRILRVARFCARFTEFRVADETMVLMRRMVDAGEVDALVAERVWQELARGLMEARPARMLEILRDCGALSRIAPAWAALPAGNRSDIEQALDQAARCGASLAVRYAIWQADNDPYTVLQAAGALRAPNDVRDLAWHAARLGPDARIWLDALADMPAQGLLDILAGADAWRKPERIDALLQSRLLRAGISGPHPGAQRLQRARVAAGSVDQGRIAARHHGQPQAIRDAISAARLAAISALPDEPAGSPDR